MQGAPRGEPGSLSSVSNDESAGSAGWACHQLLPQVGWALSTDFGQAPGGPQGESSSIKSMCC